ncbi:MAG: 2-hydroxyacid dehydrogenase [candidate division NC10 bacterium]|jgi:D-3-phosphoglycerate dehydrogenase|nr:2-hydroxyacid dehydrogenase [candidate division NC10 bacterium]
MKPEKVLVTTRSFGKEVREPMERLRREGCHILEWREGSGLPESDLLAKVTQADAWIVAFHPIGAALMDAAPRLRIIAKHGVGVDNIDISAATARDIVVTTAPSANDQAVADLALALLLSLLRRIPEANASVKAGRWERFLGCGLSGKVMGILGLGRIGQNVARRAKGFGVELIGADPFWPDDVARDIGIRRVQPNALFAQADIISLHAPLTPETTGLIGAATIAAMKPGVWIVNTSRGKVVDEKALYEALVAGKVAGYATDVFENEPPIGSPLLALPNVVATPHMGTHTRESLKLMGDRVAEAVLRVFRGERPEFVVNPEVYDRLPTAPNTRRQAALDV